MVTTLLDRLATLVRADAHGLLESLEERSLLLKQHLREAELDTARKRARLDALRDEEASLAAEVASAEAEIAALDADVALALGGGNEEVARFAARRLLARRARLRAADTRRKERAAEHAALAGRLATQEERLERLRARVRGEIARRAEAPPPWPGAEGDAIADEEVELELMRRRRGETTP
jgi:phage shock protein A